MLTQTRRTIRSLTFLACAAFVCVGAHAKPNAEDAFIEKENLFEVTAEGKYRSIRIPCLLALPDSSVLAFTSARTAVSDWATIQLLMRRSPDGGKSWEPARVVAEHGDGVADNPVAIWDDKTKEVIFMYQVDYARVYTMRSRDGGKTFSKAEEITPQLAAFQAKYKWSVIAPGPGHGIQLKNGRLVVPVWLCPGEPNKSGKGKAHRPSVTSVIYSDDHGKSWQCGDILPDTLKNMNETVAVEASDGGVLLFVRNEDPSFRKAIAYSKDGATNWTKPTLHHDLYSPICFASVLKLTGGERKHRILFANPDSRTKSRSVVKWGGRLRENLTLKLSYDDGKTWAYSKVLEPGRASYSDLTVLPDGTILCLYEQGWIADNYYNNRYMTVARFNLEWLTDGKDSLK
ncbi:sialidase family protein [Oleiharenicola lentus]|uniref:sialidase family protein n=1 Tax=Oleiharenicola lentus TaxID=2508720 RepID=UPI003F673B13